MEDGFCAKDNVNSPIERGCRHPDDYCQHRQACVIYFIEQENRRVDGGKGQDERPNN